MILGMGLYKVWRLAKELREEGCVARREEEPRVGSGVDQQEGGVPSYFYFLHRRDSYEAGRIPPVNCLDSRSSCLVNLGLLSLSPLLALAFGDL